MKCDRRPCLHACCAGHIRNRHVKYYILFCMWTEVHTCLDFLNEQKNEFIINTTVPKRKEANTDRNGNEAGSSSPSVIPAHSLDLETFSCQYFTSLQNNSTKSGVVPVQWQPWGVRARGLPDSDGSLSQYQTSRATQKDAVRRGREGKQAGS